MSDHDFDARLLDLLYGELPPDEAKAIQAEVDQDPVARKTLEAWGAVREAVADLPTSEPDPQVHYNILRAARAEVAPAEPKGFFAWLTRFAMSPAFAGAAAVMVLAVGSLVYFNQEDARPNSALDEAAKTQKPALAGGEARGEREALADADGDGRDAPGTADRPGEKRDAPAAKMADSLAKADARDRDGKDTDGLSLDDGEPNTAAAAETLARAADKKALNIEAKGEDAEVATAKPEAGIGRIAAKAKVAAPKTANKTDKSRLDAPNKGAKEATKARATRAKPKRAPRKKKAKARIAKNQRATAPVKRPADPEAPARVPPPAKVAEARKDNRGGGGASPDFAPPPPEPVALEGADAPAAQPDEARGFGFTTDLKGGDAEKSKKGEEAEKAEEAKRAAPVDATKKKSARETLEDEESLADAAADRGAGERVADGFAARDRREADQDEDVAERVRTAAVADDVVEAAPRQDARKSVQAAAPQPVVTRRSMTPGPQAGAARGAPTGGALAGAGGDGIPMPSELRQARAARQRGDHRTAVTAYSAYFERHPGHGEISRSLFEAAASYESLGDISKALRFYKLIRPAAGGWYTRAQARIAALKAVQANPPARPAAEFDSLDADLGEDRVEPRPEPPAVAPPLKR